MQDVKLASPGKLCLTSPLKVSSSLHASSTALPSFVLELRESKAPPGTYPVAQGTSGRKHKSATGDSSCTFTGQKNFTVQSSSFVSPSKSTWMAGHI